MSAAEPSNEPSRWVTRFASLIRPNGRVLDVAAGKGRHCRWLLQEGFAVTAVDRNAEPLRSLSHNRLQVIEADLEQPLGWTFVERPFDAVVVTNYLARPYFERALSALRSDGVLLYETFGSGNEAYGRPRREAFLLEPGELLERVAGKLQVVAFENGFEEVTRPRVVQRVCAVGPLRKVPSCRL